MTESNSSRSRAPGGDRRTEILNAAGRVLLRYGYRKASVDDVAREAGVSRQGVYLHFATKDALYSAAVSHLLQATVTETRSVLNAPGMELEDRLFAAFSAMAGEEITRHLDEVLQTAERLTGRSAADLEGEIVAEFVAALDRTLADSSWRRHGDSAEAVARILYATSSGLKRLTSSVPDYLAAMRQAIRLVCAG